MIYVKIKLNIFGNHRHQQNKASKQNVFFIHYTGHVNIDSPFNQRLLISKILK